VVLFCDAIYLPVRPSGPKEGVICTAPGTPSVATIRMCVRLARDRPPDDVDGRLDRRVFRAIQPASDSFSPLERVAGAAPGLEGLEVA
jgi:hypothetical protein